MKSILITRKQSFKLKLNSNSIIKLNMSARNNSKIAPKPFCKVCHDAGKSEKEYTSHFVKSEPGPNGKVVCPTLLAQECRFCFQGGHTAGYCPVIAANKKAEEKSLRLAERKEKTPTPKPTVAKKTANVFAALGSDSDSDEPVSKKVNTKSIIKSTKIATVAKPAAKVAAKEEFPALPSKPKAATVVPTMSGYASVAAKMPEQYASEKYEQELIANSIKRQMPPIQKSQVAQQAYDSDDSWGKPVAAPRPQMRASLMDWAQLEDSDSDEEYCHHQHCQGDDDEEW
jgi:hypothetical protein